MQRSRPLAIAALLALCIAAPLTAHAATDGGNQVMGIADPTSTFEIGELQGAFLKDTVAVPLYLHTDSSVTFIEARFSWNASQVALLEVVPGPGVPGSVSLSIESHGASTRSVMIHNGGAAFAIPEGQPVATLRFEVGCDLGWGALSEITFSPDASHSEYVAGGIQYSPNRNNGYVVSADEQFLYQYGSHDNAPPGSEHATWTYGLYQEIPGRITSTQVRFDPTVLRYDSITAGPDLGGGSVSAIRSGDIISVTLSSPVLPPGTSNLFVLHFGLLNGNDSYMTLVTPVAGTRVDVCGNETSPLIAPGWIQVPNHVAAADVGETNAYPSATYYDVPFRMSSNLPVNSYDFVLNFPSDKLSFVQVVPVGGYAQPIAGLLPDNTLYIASAPPSFTNYVVPGLTTVFNLRFAPRTAAAVGLVHNLTLQQDPAEHVSYLTEAPPSGEFHVAVRNDLTVSPGKITIVAAPGGGGPGCPTLFVWDGSSFVMDNTILAASDGVASPPVATDHYLVTKPVAEVDGKLRFQVREDASQISEFRGFELRVVDHPIEKPVQVAKDGAIVSTRQPFSIVWAKDSRGNDISGLIAADDGVFYSSRESGWFDVSFGRFTQEQMGGIAVGTLAKTKDPVIIHGARLARSENADRKVRVSVRTASGDWQLVSVEDPRFEPTRISTLIHPELMDPSQELVVRYAWEESYQLDVLEVNRVVPFAGKVEEPRLLAANLTKGGQIIGAKGAGAMTLSPGEAIDLVFDASALKPLEEGMKRTYVFVATGRYETPGTVAAAPLEFALGANTPNPFRGSTTIHYSLATDAKVEVRVFDVRGSLVRTLVSAFQPAGRQSVTWDGRADNGEPAPAGIYFYKMSSGAFERSRKLVFVR